VPIPVVVGPEVRSDLGALPTESLRREALRYLFLLKARPNLGRPLEDHPEIGDLSNCRKIYFDEGPDRSPRYRIVYRLLPDEVAPQKVDVIAVGPRRGFFVYKLAIRRLSDGGR
jgi:hypothetical protein